MAALRDDQFLITALEGDDAFLAAAKEDELLIAKEGD